MEILHEFGLNPTLLLAQIVNFTILLLLLKKFFYKPVLKVLEERKQKVAKSLKDADEIEKRLEKTSQEQEKLLEKARLEANNLVKDAKDEARALAETTLSETKKTIGEMMAKNKADLDLEKEKMIQQSKNELAELVMAISLKVSKKAMTETTNQKVIKEAIEEMSQK